MEKSWEHLKIIQKRLKNIFDNLKTSMNIWKQIEHFWECL